MDNTNPLKLALCLNYSAFKYENEQNFEDAIEIAKNGFFEALAQFQNLDGQE